MVQTRLRWSTLCATAMLATTATLPTARAALMLDGTTHAQMTAENPFQQGFSASATASIGGQPITFNSDVTHLWGRYYAIASHQITNGVSLNSIYTGPDYMHDTGNTVAIARIDLCPTADFAIITAAQADDTPRNPLSKLVGLADAQTGGLGNTGSTLYVRFADPRILAFINQITGSSITVADVEAGNSVIGDVHSGDHVWGRTFGAFGTPSTGLSNPDGLSGQYQGPCDPNGPWPGDAEYSDHDLYFLTVFRNDASFGPFNGKGVNGDSGSSAIVIVPEPGVAGVLGVGVLTLLRRGRGRNA